MKKKNLKQLPEQQALDAMIRGLEALGCHKANKEPRVLNIFEEYSRFPKIFLRENEPKNYGQRQMVYVCEELYQGSAKWLRWYRSQKIELLTDLDIGYRPFAKLSLHRYELCRQLWLFLPFAQSVANDPNILWLTCEMSECIHALKANGFWGEPLVNSKGKTFGKREIYKIKSSELTKLLNSLKNYGCLPQDLRRPIPSNDYFGEAFTDVLWTLAIHQAIDTRDRTLQDFLENWLSHKRDYERLTKELKYYQIPTIRGDDLHWTGKDKKTYTPKPETKRAGGRPPLGSK
ncbi:hypothetical protein Syn7502_02291 [Synechococcus sp. PCC 7502]|uniref:hypothetical protein n=1 Tax=Synechococcus sp. PCC 7502 TaxID=1173263 RepID=UPI00029FA332|nr:hypothetical protein [Synechococcus sp. PCC 7502]AFY74296.1 hypothetical protein Syn7502_02291 [Synechococcus sp. PCC 7502]